MGTTQTTASTLPKSVDLAEMNASFRQHGYAVARGLFSESEVEEIKSTFTRIAENGPVPGHFEPVSKEESDGDPLRNFRASFIRIASILSRAGI